MRNFITVPYHWMNSNEKQLLHKSKSHLQLNSQSCHWPIRQQAKQASQVDTRCKARINFAQGHLDHFIFDILWCCWQHIGPLSPCPVSLTNICMTIDCGSLRYQNMSWELEIAWPSVKTTVSNNDLRMNYVFMLVNVTLQWAVCSYYTAKMKMTAMETKDTIEKHFSSVALMFI